MQTAIDNQMVPPAHRKPWPHTSEISNNFAVSSSAFPNMLQGIVLHITFYSLIYANKFRFKFVKRISSLVMTSRRENPATSVIESYNDETFVASSTGEIQLPKFSWLAYNYMQIKLKLQM